MRAPKRINIAPESDAEEEKQARLVMRAVRVKIEPGEEIKTEVKREQEEEEEEVETQGKLKTLYLAIPMRTKNGNEVRESIQAIVARLNSSGRSVRRIHSDRGCEFTTVSLRTWARSNGIHVTTTSADDSRANGRAEGGIGIYKRRVRVLLRAAKLDHDYWCYAVGHETERRWRDFRGEKKEGPGFGQKVMFKEHAFHQKGSTKDFSVVCAEGIFLGWCFDTTRTVGYVKTDERVTRATTIVKMPTTETPEDEEEVPEGWRRLKDPDERVYYEKMK